MEHGAVVDRARHVRRIAAARGHHGFQRLDAPVDVDADLVVGQEIVPLAGEIHVVVAIEPDLAGPAGNARAECRDRGPLRGLRLLAAERAAHAAHLHRHIADRHVEHVGNEMLHLARMLRRGVDQHVAVLTRDGERHLAFEIKVLLPADAQPAFHAIGAFGERGGAVVLAEGVVGQDVLVGGERVIDGHAVRAGRDLKLGELDGAPRFAARLRHHRERDLPVKLDASFDEDRIVVQHRPDIVLAGNVCGGEHSDHAGRGAHRIEIDAKQLPDGYRRTADRDMQQAFRLPHVVHEGRGPGDMLGRRVMAQRAPHHAQAQFLRAAVKLKRHPPPPGSR